MFMTRVYSFELYFLIAALALGKPRGWPIPKTHQNRFLMSNDTESPELPSFNHNTQFVRTQPPNPAYKFGDRVSQSEEGKKWMEGEKLGWKTFDSKENSRELYQLLLSGICPRPVAFVSSVSETGVENLAPFSYFNTVSAHPPTISISINAGIGEKDSSRNIKATKGFTVNIISEPWIQQANAACINSPRDVSDPF
ncbi:hypothetical protein E1B28_011480 [Marasmius oreades]|uniref:Flavin reductase like domain-containing protein n=1 Tax=Marasmius oreades TaxID=181124 RepID=A0A9P7RU75_9AGAR|nr:uncharacterized protein E1B28_011480 [Marasmius oreades]KAG7089834.1 hypothetical protein E1B28_011480 [Marasmius oreades]